MSTEPVAKRAIAFIDGQNLFYAAKTAFGSSYPDYDPKKLAEWVCRSKDWTLTGVRFYTGVPDAEDNAKWNAFWSKKLLAMSRQGIAVYQRALKYRNKTVRLPDGKTHTFLSASEKGIDIRIALDAIRMAVRKEYDVAVIFSQDQDFSEVADEIRLIASEQGRWIKIASAFPSSPAVRALRGINKTDWIKIDRASYQGCVDAHDYGL